MAILIEIIEIAIFIYLDWFCSLNVLKNVVKNTVIFLNINC